MRTKMTRWQKVGLFAAGLLPGLLFLLGLFLWIFGAPVLTFSYALDFLILPALTWWLLYRITRKGWRPRLRAILCILILAVSAWLMFQLNVWGHYSLYNHAEGEKALTHYQDDSDEYRNMPEVGDLGEPEKVEYHYFYNQFGLFFDSDCYTLICTYAPEDYVALTEALETRYTFHTKPLDVGETDLPPLYTLDGYEFRFLEMESDIYHLTYPKSMVLIGTNDETHEIVWSFYDDDDLDWITDPQKFLLNDCGWKYIR